MAHPARIIALNIKLAAPLLERIRALAPEPGLMPAARAALNSATCRQQPMPAQR